MRMSGLEPMTPCMSSRYSNQLSYTLTTETIIPHDLRFVNPYFEKIENFSAAEKMCVLPLRAGGQSPLPLSFGSRRRGSPNIRSTRVHAAGRLLIRDFFEDMHSNIHICMQNRHAIHMPPRYKIKIQTDARSAIHDTFIPKSLIFSEIS